MPVLRCISSFQGTSYKRLHDTTSPFASCCFTLPYTYISRYDFLQVFGSSLTIIRKNIFVTNSTFLMNSPKLLYLLNSQNPPSVTKKVLLILPNVGPANITAKTTLPFIFLPLILQTI